MGERVVMLLENNPYPQDTRVRNEAETLAAAGHRVTVLAPRGRGQPSRERLHGVDVLRYRAVWATSRSASESAFPFLKLISLSSPISSPPLSET